MMTVVMATHNGADTLPRVLDAYGRLHQPGDEWRLVVVDNASVDATAAIVSQFRSRLPLSSLWEPRRGQNRARNRALDEIAGDLVVFTDDDAVPDPAWLVELRRAADAQPRFAVFGGAIRPRWEAKPPGWVLKHVPLAPCFAVTDPAWADGPIRADHVFSPNMAIRSSIFADGHRFDEAIGPQPGEYPMGSETELTRRLTRLGLQAWHCPSAVVEHIVPATHLHPRWLLDRAVRYGRGVYRLSVVNEPRRRCPRTRALRHVTRNAAVQGAALARAAWWRRSAEEVFARRWRLHMLLGYAAEAGLLPWKPPAPRP